MSKSRTDLVVLAAHWAVAAAALVSLLTGFRIAADDPGAWLSACLAAVAPQGDVIALHVWSGGLLLAAAAAYVVYLRATGLSRRFSAGRRGGPARDARTALQAGNVQIYLALFVVVCLLAGLGLLLYAGWLPPIGVSEGWVQTAHYAGAWAFVGLVALHVAAQYALGTLASGRRRRASFGCSRWCGPAGPCWASPAAAPVPARR